MDTIFAQASARGRAGVSIIRISGPAARTAASALAGSLPPARRAGLRVLRAADGSAIDEALVLVFDAGHSFTGEDIVELHTHGGTAVVAAVLRQLAGQPSLRLAEAGEFTRRALMNDRMDLAQVEGLGDLIDAETEAQRRQALRVLSGALGRKVEGWRAELMAARALVTALIDFSDEEIPAGLETEVRRICAGLIAAFEAEIAGARIGERIREGFEVAIVGAPNVGKSTLLNALAGREAAITSEVAGTTRDVIELRMDLDGLAVTFLDTAGIRETEDSVERIGVRRALDRAAAADLRVVLLSDGAEAPAIDLQPDDIVVRAKGDLLPAAGDSVSGKTGQGIDALTARIASILENRASGAATATRERHRLAILRARDCLVAAVGLLDSASGQVDLIAAELLFANNSLESLVGRIDVEHLLGEIFARFCIGK